MAGRAAPLRALDPNVKAGASGLAAPPSKIPRSTTAGKTGDGAKQELETKLHEVLDEYDELRNQYGELEEQNRKLRVECINMEEEATEWKKSYESLQTEGTELFQTYERKCAMLKEVSKQLDEHKHKLAERDGLLKEVSSSKEVAEQERDELREKVKLHSEAMGKHETRYLTLKDEHNQTLAKLDDLQQQLRDAMRGATRADTAAQPVTAQQSMEQLESTRKLLKEAEDREQKAMAELHTAKQHVQRLMAQQSAGATCASPLASDATVGALSVITPCRVTSQTPGKGAPPKTPSVAMMEMTNLSPESLRERAESLLISNDLLRQELNASKRERDDHAESVASLEAAVRDLKSQVDECKKSMRLATEQQVAAEEERDVALADARELTSRVAELEEAGHAAGQEVVQELESVKTQLAAAETRQNKAEKELAAARKQVETNTAAAKNAENDMRLMYKRHKKEMTELQDKFKTGELEERYRVATHKAMQMEALVHKWVGYAREMTEVRALQERRAVAIEDNAAAVRALMQDAVQMKEEADSKVSKWRRQCRRMEKDMTKLVHIKTRALEERKELHEKYLELYQELQAQDEYAQKLEASEEALRAKLEAQSAEEVSAVRQETEERVRLEMEEKLIAAQAQYDGLLEETEALRSKVSELEAHVAQADESASNSAVVAKGQLEEMEARAANQQKEIQTLTAEVAELRAASEQHDQIFEGTMLEMQAKEEKCAELEEKLSALNAELQTANKKLLATETAGENEREATQDALDELTKDLSTAHEQLATAEAQAEEAERRAHASQQAAACGVARLTRVTVGMAADEDNTTDMIDPELRLHWCDDDYERKLAETKTPHELRALLVGIASTVEHLLNSGAARRDQMGEKITALSADLEKAENRSEAAAMKVVTARAETAQVRKELEEATKNLLEAVESGETLKTKLAAVDAARQRSEELEEESARLNALLEDTSRANVELSKCKEVRARPSSPQGSRLLIASCCCALCCAAAPRIALRILTHVLPHTPNRNWRRCGRNAMRCRRAWTRA